MDDELQMSTTFDLASLEEKLNAARELNKANEYYKSLGALQHEKTKALPVINGKLYDSGLIEQLTARQAAQLEDAGYKLMGYTPAAKGFGSFNLDGKTFTFNKTIPEEYSFNVPGLTDEPMLKLRSDLVWPSLEGKTVKHTIDNPNDLYSSEEMKAAYDRPAQYFDDFRDATTLSKFQRMLDTTGLMPTTTWSETIYPNLKAFMDDRPSKISKSLLNSFGLAMRAALPYGFGENPLSHFSQAQGHFEPFWKYLVKGQNNRRPLLYFNPEVGYNINPRGEGILDSSTIAANKYNETAPVTSDSTSDKVRIEKARNIFDSELDRLKAMLFGKDIASNLVQLNLLERQNILGNEGPDFSDKFKQEFTKEDAARELQKASSIADTINERAKFYRKVPKAKAERRAEATKKLSESVRRKLPIGKRPL